jgi:MFS family permease
MTGEIAVPLEPTNAETPAPVVTANNRFGLFLFGGALMILVGLGDPSMGIINIPVAFFLKNRLHLTANELAVFKLWTAIPLFLSFAFGFLRDRWNVFGRGDGGHLMLFGGLTALTYAVLAYAPPIYGVWLAGILISTAVFQVVLGAGNGLISVIGQQRALAGQMSALLSIAASAPILLSSIFGGLLSGYLEGEGATSAARLLFLIGAAIMAGVAVVGGFQPRVLFGAATVERSQHHFLKDVGRLLRYWPIYPVIVIQVLWQFSPATGIVLQYHMSNTLHGSDFQWGAWNAVFYGSFLPVYVGYGFICQRFTLRTLLWFGFGLAVFQMTPLLFVHTAWGAIIAAAPMGMIGGVAQAALMDLAIRSCPPKLQGTMMMLITASIYYVAVRFGDLFGTFIYDHHGGFIPTVWITIAIYALILPVILLVPKGLIGTRDGEALALAGD